MQEKHLKVDLQDKAYSVASGVGEEAGEAGTSIKLAWGELCVDKGLQLILVFSKAISAISFVAGSVTIRGTSTKTCGSY